MSKSGLITVLSESGEYEKDIEIPGCPQITGLHFSRSEDDILYITETSKNQLLKYNLAA